MEFVKALAYIFLTFGFYHKITNGLALASDGADPDEKRNTSELIESRGYTVETHEITTEDGYILTYYRIPHGKTSNVQSPAPKGPVLIQHGLLSSSFDWFIQNEDKTLPFLLAEEGYDVWIGNSRGTKYSRKHLSLTDKDPDYWKFSWEEMGKYDLPAAIDYILSKTGSSCLYYIGHSMGTTQFFVMSALEPDYNQKICLMSAYAPVAYLSNARGPIRALGPVASAATIVDGGDLATELGAGEQLPGPLLEAMHKYAPIICTPEMIALNVCENILFLIMGFDPKQVNVSKVPMSLAHFPDSTSVQTLIHYGQEMTSGNFEGFKSGILTTLEGVLGSFPTFFDRRKMTAPMAFYWGENDSLADPKDVIKFSLELPNLVRNYRIHYSEFNHMDFLTAIDAYDLLYKTTIDFMNTFPKQSIGAVQTPPPPLIDLNLLQTIKIGIH